MPNSNKTLIMKFGGASVKTPACFSHIADLVIERLKQYPKIVVVVSAMGDMTNELIAMAKQVHSDPPRREYDMLISSGERISISLLAMAIAAKNQEAMSFTGSQSGIITSDMHSEARIITVNPYRLAACLEAGKIAIVAGFQGMSHTREITTLGRGGSDITALALGVAFKAAKVEFYKDVLGIYEKDPKIDPSTTLYSKLTHQEALAVVKNSGSRVLHPRAIELAEKNGLPLHILSFTQKQAPGTLIISEDAILPSEPVYE